MYVMGDEWRDLPSCDMLNSVFLWVVECFCAL